MSISLELRRVAAVLTEAPADLRWLSTSEHARLERLRLPARRHQYLAGHWLARCVIARRHGLDALEVVLDEQRGLPPAVRFAGAPDCVSLSISHSGDWIGAASADAPVGIDIEQYPRRHSLAEVAELLLAEGETSQSVNDEDLLQRWVAKEARINATRARHCQNVCARCGYYGRSGTRRMCECTDPRGFFSGLRRSRALHSI